MKLPSVFLTECKIGGLVKRRKNDLFKRLSKFNLNWAKVEDAPDSPDNGIFVSLRKASRVKPRW